MLHGTSNTAEDWLKKYGQNFQKKSLLQSVALLI